MNIELKLSRRLFNEVYFPYLFDYAHRYEVYYGSAGSGKSHFVFQKIVVKALNRKRKVLVIRRYGNSNLNSTYQMTLDTLSKFKMLSLCNVNKSTLTITLPNGSVFIFSGCDDAEKLKSITGITDIVVEEATELTVDDVDQLDLRLRAKKDNLQMFFMFNPVSKTNWVYKRWFADGVTVGEDTFVLKTTYLDNAFLPQSYIDTLEQMRVNNPTYYRIYALGEFCSLDKLVFDNWVMRDFDHTQIDGQLAIGIDFGFTNDLCTIVSSVIDDKNKKIYVFDAWGDKGITNQVLAEILIHKGYAKSVIIADSAEPKSIEELKRAGIRRIKGSQKGADSILYGIQTLQQYQIVVNPECKGLIEEFQNYSWQKDKLTNEYVNKPVDKYNHYIDALRYSLQCLGNNKVRSMSKAAFGL